MDAAQRVIRRGRRFVLALGIISLMALLLSACGGEDAADSAPAEGAGGEVDAEAAATDAAPYMVPPKEGPYTVGFSNSFAGNSWRTQMVAELEYAVANNDLISEVFITNADNDVSLQNSQISDLVARDVDILLVNAGSETALNAELERAHEAGIVVVSFDGTASSPVSITVNTDQAEFGQAGANYLVEAMGGEGSVFALHGIAGNPVSEARWAAAKQVLEDAGITIVAEANADWDLAQGRAAAADLLAAHPDVTGVYSQGGAMSLGVLQALEAAGRDPLPVPGEGNNEFLKEWARLAEANGYSSIAPSQPPSLVVDALDVALRVLAGEDPGPTPAVELPVITDDTLATTVRPDLPNSLWLPTALPEDEILELFS